MINYSLSAYVKVALLIILVTGNLSLSLPDSGPPAAGLKPLLSFNNNFIKPIFSMPFESIGLKNRWGIFSHDPNETFHVWKNSLLVVTVKSQNGREKQYTIPEIRDDESYYDNILRGRLLKFRDNIWSFQKIFNKPTAWHFAAQSIDEEHFSAPVKVHLHYTVSIIPSPGDPSTSKPLPPEILQIGDFTFFDNDLPGDASK